MMDVVFNATRWAVEKALGPVTDTVLEAWAASRGLGQNVEALKMELLYVQAMFKPNFSMETDNQALQELLLKLHNLGHRAEDALDELDYFRIQDELGGTSEAADEHAKGCGYSLVLNARHTAKAVSKLLWLPACCTGAVPSAGQRASDTVSSTRHIKQQPDGAANGCMRKLVYRTSSTIHTLGKRLPCLSLPLLFADADDSGMTTELVFNRADTSKKMSDIVEQLRPIRKEVSEILRTLGPRERENPKIGHIRPISISESIEQRVYGRDLMINSIRHDITKGKYCDKEDLTVLLIYGQGGIGKTTLTQFIYQNKDMQKHFDVKVWECVSLDFNADKLLKNIEGKIDPIKDEKVGTPGELIGQRLKSKRFLLVLDDMWKCRNEDEWKRLLLPFKKSEAKGNVIIVTTRLPVLAETIKATNTTELKGLEQKEFEELFLYFVFGDNQSARKDHAFLLETGRKIMEKLKGSPLAAKTVGRLLSQHLELDHWIRVLESREWGFAKDDTDIIPALKLSYDYLPFNLQQCFLYCALFPEDYKFHKEKLIYFWIGLDILHSNPQNKSMEDIGLDNFDKLVTHGFFKKEERYGRIYYLIHDLLHDLALKVAANECLVISQTNMRSLEIRPSVRHLCIDLEQADNSENFISELREVEAKLDIDNLQTLMVFGKLDGSFTIFMSDLIRRSNSLRVLHLPKMYSSMEFPILPHLRYLRLGCNFLTEEIHLPSMLSRFYHLRILDLQNWAGSLDLPRDMSNLTKLGHFLTKDDIHHSKICQVGKLQLLHELRRFEVNKESTGFEVKQLEKLNEIRELGIYNLEKILTEEEAIEANLMHKKYLKRLTLDWHIRLPKNERDVEGLVLEKLEPQRNLQDLRINGHGSGSRPTWLGSKLSLKLLRSLHLAGVEWEVLPSLGHMWGLRELILEDMSTLKEFGPHHFGSITEQSFCSLKRLTLIALKGFKKWDLGDRCHLLSQLEVLIINGCTDLSGLPFADTIYSPPKQDQEGKIHWFPNLKEISIINCPKIMTLPPIPWTQTLCSIKIEGVGSSVLESLEYIKSPSEIELLKIVGKDDLHSLDEKVLVFNNLTDLQQLRLMECPPLAPKHLQMLTSLKSLFIRSQHVSVQPVNESEAEWQSAIEDLLVTRWKDTEKELSQFISHFPKLSKLNIEDCEKIKQIGVVVLQQPTAHVTSLASSTVKMEDEQAARRHQQMAEAEEIENIEDGLLLLPAHLSDSLRDLVLFDCDEVSLVGPSPLLPNHSRGGGGGGLQALRSLQRLQVNYCPKFLSAYKKTSFSSSCFPFPSSLKQLDLRKVGLETLQPLANLTSLSQLILFDRGTSDGLWPLVTQGQLRKLAVAHSPRFFVGSDPLEGPKDEDQVRLLRHSSKLQELTTDDAVGFLAEPICTILSSSLTSLRLIDGNDEVIRFTKEQEEALQLLTSLQHLEFSGLYKLQCLPAGLHTLPSLKRLEISLCKLLSFLPSDGLPRSLQELDVRICENEELKQQCRKFVEDHPGIKLRI